MAGARNITGLLALVVVSVDKETTPLPPEVVPACRNRNIPRCSYYKALSLFFKKKEKGIRRKQKEEERTTSLLRRRFVISSFQFHPRKMRKISLPHPSYLFVLVFLVRSFLFGRRSFFFLFRRSRSFRFIRF